MGQDGLWTQLFADKPVEPGVLGALQANIMAEVLAHPVDFRECRIMMRRRQVGLILAGCLLILGVALLGLLVWQRRLLEQLGVGLLWPFTGLLANGWFSHLPEQITTKIDVLRQVAIGLRYLWSEYSEPITGIAIAIVLSGIRLPSLRQDFRSSD